MQLLQYLFLGAVLAATACGNNSPGSESSTSGGSTFGGESATAIGGGGNDGTGGTSNSIATGGTSTTGGSSVSAGGTNGAKGGTTGLGGAATGGASAIVPGSPCTANCPTGTVYQCFGDGCPLGACDNTFFRANVPCTTTYPKAIDKDTVFCAAGQNGNYCFLYIATALFEAVVTCTDGAPSIETCAGGCGYSAFGAKC